jgi:hypothetical protein
MYARLSVALVFALVAQSICAVETQQIRQNHPLIVAVVDASGAAWPRARVAVVNARSFTKMEATADVKGVAEFDPPSNTKLVVLASVDEKLTCVEPDVRVLSLISGEHRRITMTVLTRKCGVVE